MTRIRVFQGATGNVGTEMIKRVGRDAGEVTSADMPLRAFAGRFKP